MAKKKKQNKKVGLLTQYDSYMNETYDDIISEIQDMQIILQREDKRIQKKARKAARKGVGYYNITAEKRKVRQRLIGKMEGNNFFNRALEILKQLAPIVTIIARLICALILAILNIDEVKVNISKEALIKINNLYSKAMAVI